VADELAPRTFQSLQSLVFALLVDQMRDTRHLHPTAGLIDKNAAVVGLMRGKRHGAQPVNIIQQGIGHGRRHTQ